MRREFARVGVNDFRFIDAYDADCVQVQQLFHSDFVVKYPPCFRCGRAKCECENKALIPAQIGNWLSHMEAWQRVRENRDRLALICEDDIRFGDRYQTTLSMLASNPHLQVALRSPEPLLLRLGWALAPEHRYMGAPYLTTQLKMSNPCYALSHSMADKLLLSFRQMGTTSDVYIHELVGPTVNHFTAIPPLAHDLSWSTGEMASEIRPKQKHVDRLKKRLADCSAKDPEYAVLVLKVQKEEQRIRDYERTHEGSLLDSGRSPE
jgi:GR25 family glycosyltransferase involved in LPS biosynthesis